MKKSTDTIGNRTRDLPVCSVVPQPTAPPHTPITRVKCRFLRQNKGSLLCNCVRRKTVNQVNFRPSLPDFDDISHEFATFTQTHTKSFKTKTTK
jgi:hypothetical protein